MPSELKQSFDQIQKAEKLLNKRYDIMKQKRDRYASNRMSGSYQKLKISDIQSNIMSPKSNLKNSNCPSFEQLSFEMSFHNLPQISRREKTSVNNVYEKMLSFNSFEVDEAQNLMK